ncbi:HTH-type transcriptional repressor NsrR [BD1-7 clade bacterium]|uniref:HTH-type transcriptional repressor NsrR n=1 Tax=BD1-7 clade bacterium TaxID=2029982 RepID=A0A5S9QBJ7_9GAMM|nr:HTH-type transcriptional repressor NsrR [BD1-7 clade bacterium]
MQLTKHTDYAFRALIYLASMPEDEDLTTIQRVVDEFDLSRNHMTKIINKMVNHGWVKAIRGKQGGIRLAVAPETINARDVVELMEQTLTPVNCVAPECSISRVCRLRGVLANAQNAYMDHIGQFTLADMITDPVVQVLHFSEPMAEDAGSADVSTTNPAAPASSQGVRYYQAD